MFRKPGWFRGKSRWFRKSFSQSIPFRRRGFVAVDSLSTRICHDMFFPFADTVSSSTDFVNLADTCTISAGKVFHETNEAVFAIMSSPSTENDNFHVFDGLLGDPNPLAHESLLIVGSYRDGPSDKSRWTCYPAQIGFKSIGQSFWGDWDVSLLMATSLGASDGGGVYMTWL